MPYLVRTCYPYPERTREGFNERGLRVVERVPGHPTRPARATDHNSWWQAATADEAEAARAAGADVRESP